MVKFIFLIMVLFILPSSLMAHGDSPGGDDDKHAAKEQPRLIVATPALLEPELLKKFATENKIPTDVLLVSCNLTESAVCRGVSISLSDKHGKRVLVGHSGSDGWIGFQGLKSDAEYKLKIESSKYAGETYGRPGLILRILAGRISVEGSN